MSGSLSWLISKKICVCDRNAQPWSEKSTQNAVLVTLSWSFFCPSWELLLWTWNSTLFSRTAFKKVAFGLTAFDLRGAVVKVGAKRKLKSAIFFALNPIVEVLLAVYIFFNLLGASFFDTPFLGYLSLAVSEMAAVALGVFLGLILCSRCMPLKQNKKE
jgi:hypothetical protein